jgi:hypothetical protein
MRPYEMGWAAGLGEVDPPPVQPFAGGVGPVAGRRQLAGRQWTAGASEYSAPFVGEGEASRVIGVPGDAEAAVVVLSVVAATEGDQVGGVGVASVQP